MRSSANSRVRCATVIENVLKMMNAPTNSEMPANASSAVCRKPRLSRMSLDWLAACSEPVRTCTVGPSSRVSSRLTACASAALLDGRVDLVELVDLARDALGLGQREHRDGRAAERVDALDLDDADDPERLLGLLGRRSGSGRRP